MKANLKIPPQLRGGAEGGGVNNVTSISVRLSLSKSKKLYREASDIRSRIKTKRHSALDVESHKMKEKTKNKQ